MLSSPVAAHTKLAESVPGADTTLEGSPEVIELRFSQPVRLTAITVTGKDAEASLGAIPDQSATDFSIAILQPLIADAYLVEWRAVSADTHVVSGDFTFRVTGP